MRKASRNSELGAFTFSFEGHARDIYGVGGCGVGGGRGGGECFRGIAEVRVGGVASVAAVTLLLLYGCSCYCMAVAAVRLTSLSIPAA